MMGAILLKESVEQQLHSALESEEWSRVAELARNPATAQIVRNAKVGWGGGTALHMASYCQKADITNTLLDAGAGLSSRDNEGHTPLHIAALSGSLLVARTLLDRGADVTDANAYGWTPLHAAAVNGHMEMAMLLLEYGAQPNTPASDGRTPVEVAEASGRHQIVGLLCRARATIERTPKPRRRLVIEDDDEDDDEDDNEHYDEHGVQQGAEQRGPNACMQLISTDSAQNGCSSQESQSNSRVAHKNGMANTTYDRLITKRRRCKTNNRDDNRQGPQTEAADNLAQKKPRASTAIIQSQSVSQETKPPSSQRHMKITLDNAQCPLPRADKHSSNGHYSTPSATFEQQHAMSALIGTCNSTSPDPPATLRQPQTPVEHKIKRAAEKTRIDSMQSSPIARRAQFTPSSASAVLPPRAQFKGQQHTQPQASEQQGKDSVDLTSAKAPDHRQEMTDSQTVQVQSVLRLKCRQCVLPCSQEEPPECAEKRSLAVDQSRQGKGTALGKALQMYGAERTKTAQFLPLSEPSADLNNATTFYAAESGLHATRTPTTIKTTAQAQNTSPNKATSNAGTIKPSSTMQILQTESMGLVRQRTEYRDLQLMSRHSGHMLNRHNTAWFRIYDGRPSSPTETANQLSRDKCGFNPGRRDAATTQLHVVRTTKEPEICVTESQAADVLHEARSTDETRPGNATPVGAAILRQEAADSQDEVPRRIPQVQHRRGNFDKIAQNERHAEQATGVIGRISQETTTSTRHRSTIQEARPDATSASKPIYEQLEIDLRHEIAPKQRTNNANDVKLANDTHPVRLTAPPLVDTRGSNDRYEQSAEQAFARNRIWPMELVRLNPSGRMQMSVYQRRTDIGHLNASEVAKLMIQYICEGHDEETREEFSQKISRGVHAYRLTGRALLAMEPTPTELARALLLQQRSISHDYKEPCVERDVLYYGVLDFIRTARAMHSPSNTLTR